MVDGLLVAPNNVAELRDAIRAAADPVLRERLGRAASQRIAKFHMPHHYSARIRRALLRCPERIAVASGLDAQLGSPEHATASQETVGITAPPNA
jgi:hypothetical protein